MTPHEYRVTKSAVSYSYEGITIDRGVKIAARGLGILP
jgi:hypothetical protein